MKCLLCHSAHLKNLVSHFECEECALTFKNPSVFLSPEEESNRYKFHQNDKENSDSGYIEFLNSFISPLLPFIIEKKSLLDYGSGPYPMLTNLIKEKRPDLAIDIWDPFFTPGKKLTGHFDVITSTEVLEHFHNPALELGNIMNLLSKEAIFGIKTVFYSPETDYKNWWYKNDPTHVVFYSEKTFNYIAQKYHLDILYNDHKSIIIFKKS